MPVPSTLSQCPVSPSSGRSTQGVAEISVNAVRLPGVSSGNHLRAADGFMWEVPVGPIIIRYTAVIKDGTWREVGDRIRLAQLPRWLIGLTLQKRTHVCQCSDSVAAVRRVRDIAIRPDKGYVAARHPSQLNGIPQ
jgi:hypothetical protein